MLRRKSLCLNIRKRNLKPDIQVQRRAKYVLSSSLDKANSIMMWKGMLEVTVLRLMEFSAATRWYRERPTYLPLSSPHQRRPWMYMCGYLCPHLQILSILPVYSCSEATLGLGFHHLGRKFWGIRYLEWSIDVGCGFLVLCVRVRMEGSQG